jgi:hypothetical protein
MLILTMGFVVICRRGNVRRIFLKLCAFWRTCFTGFGDLLLVKL